MMAGGNPPDRAAGGLKCQPFPKSLQVDKAEVQENAVSREMGFAFRKGTAAGREEWPRSWAGGWEERVPGTLQAGMGSAAVGCLQAGHFPCPGLGFPGGKMKALN